MKVLVFGATGMVGQGALRESLVASDVSHVTTVGRSPVELAHPKLEQLVQADLMELGSRATELQDYDACFFCLGVSSSGISEEAYSQITYGVTLHVAGLLSRWNPQMTFVYVSGAGTDSSEKGSSMWARVKGKTENALTKLPFKGVYLFRPGIIQPLQRLRSKTPSYRYFYYLASPLLSLIRWIAPSAIVTTESIGKAMLNAARQEGGRTIVEAGGIMPLANRPTH